MTLKRTLSNSFDDVDQIINNVEENPKRFKLTETVNLSMIKPTHLPSEMLDHILSYLDSDEIQLNWMVICQQWYGIIDNCIARGRIRVEFDTSSLPNGIDKESLIGILENSPSVRCIDHVFHSCSGDGKVIQAIFSNNMFVETKLELQKEDEEEQDNSDGTKRFRLTLCDYFDMNKENLEFIETSLIRKNSISDLFSELFISHPYDNVSNKKKHISSKVFVGMIQSFKNLKVISLNRVLNETRFAEILSVLPYRKVEELILKGNRFELLPGRLLEMEALTIKHLDLTGNIIGKEVLLELLTCAAFENVEELILRNCFIEEMAERDSTNGPKFSMKSLKTLDLSGNGVETDVIGELIHEFAGSLEEIRLSNMELNGEDHLELLKSLSSAINLTSVDIRNNYDFKSDELIELIEHLKNHCEIEDVNISGIEIGEKTAELLVRHFKRRGITVKYEDEESDDEDEEEEESDDA